MGKGGMVMEYRIVEREKFKVLARLSNFATALLMRKGIRRFRISGRSAVREGVFDTLTACTGKGDIYGSAGQSPRNVISLAMG